MNFTFKVKNFLFLSLMLSIFFGFLITSCNKDETVLENNGKSVKQVDQIDQNMLPIIESRLDQKKDNYQYYYDMVYKDEYYQQLLRKATESMNSFNFQFSDIEKSPSSEKILREKFTEIESNKDLQKLFDYWNQEKFRFGDKATILTALVDATTDLTSHSKGAPTIETPCYYYYGSFVVGNAPFDPPQISQVFGCCLGLYSEVLNCNYEAINEFIVSLGLNGDEAFMGLFSTLIGAIRGGMSGGAWGVGTFALAQALVGTLNYFELMVDVWNCESPMVFNQAQWSQECNCLCPYEPSCFSSPTIDFDPFTGSWYHATPADCF